MTIEESLRYQPEYIEAEELVKLGIYQHRKAFTFAKARNDAPPCTKVNNKRWVVSKQDLIKWMKERTK